jgi:hypothetical protein
MGYNPHPADQQWTADDLERAEAAKDHQAINTARKAGHLHELLAPTPEPDTDTPPAARGPLVPTES